MNGFSKIIVAFWLAVASTSWVVTAAVSWTATPFNPPSFPLAVRSPYLSCWLPQESGTALNAAWPTFWTGSILGWAGYVRVDGRVYTFLGSPAVAGATLATQKSSTFTATQSIFVMTAGGVDLTATFLSPVEPTDLTHQSLPFSYLALSAASNDGSSHSVQVYTDISAEWVSGDNSLVATWNSTTTGDILTHQIQVQNPAQYQEISDHIQHGEAYYSTNNLEGTTYQTGEDAIVRAQFVNQGTLNGTLDTTFRAIQERWPVFAYAHDLGTVSSTSSTPVVFSVGHVRDPAVQYIVENGALQDRSLYFRSTYNTAQDAINFFLGDYTNALSRAKEFDQKVQSDASGVSESYAGLVALSIRQAFATIEITISKDASGAYNASDILIFMKEISSNGNTNTVDVIFPSWPLFLYTNPDLGKYLLLPIFKYQATGQYPNTFAIHDIGAHYPRAIGHNDGQDEAMPLEECGNMIIMTLSHYQRTNDRSIIDTYGTLLKQWTQYLIEEALIPASQISTDDFAGPLANQTNLAIKGMVGIRAMAEISCLQGDDTQSQNLTTIATDYVSKWQNLATSSDGRHLTLSYGNDSSWGLSYNLYVDKLLGLNLFPDAIYEMQSTWYPTVLNSYGAPLDTRHTYTKSDWLIWTAAIASSTTVRDSLIGAVYNYASNGLNKNPLSDWYDTIDGKSVGFSARPVVAGHLALMNGILPTNSSGRGNCGITNIQEDQSDTGAATALRVLRGDGGAIWLTMSVVGVIAVANWLIM